LPDPGFGGTIAAVSTQPEFVTLPETTVVGLRVESTFQELFQQVPAAWRSAFAREGEFDAGLGARLDVGFCDCSLGAKDGVYTEIIGVRTTADAAVPAGMQKVTLPEARYATLRWPASRRRSVRSRVGSPRNHLALTDEDGCTTA